MAEKMSEQEKLAHEVSEKAKSYKTPHDVERLHHMAAAAFYLRDHSAAAPISGSIGRELLALALKQGEQDDKDAEEAAKKLAAAKEADAKAAAEAAEEHESSSPPPRAAARSR